MSQNDTLPVCRRHVSGLTCTHAAYGLCHGCEMNYLNDPVGWFYFGDHPEGIAMAARFDADLARAHAIINDTIELGDGGAR